jgi:hypothetical protein
LHNQWVRRGEKRSLYPRVRKDAAEAKKDEERKHEKGGRKVLRLSGFSGAAGAAVAWDGE